MPPKLMRAVLLLGHGGFDQLEYRDDVRTPNPASGEVLIQIGAASINNTDINTRVGWYSKSVPGEPRQAANSLTAQGCGDSAWTGHALLFPRIQGIDACGRIVAVGASIDTGRIGERVLVDPVLRADPSAPWSVGYLGSERDGAFADFTAVPAANAHAITSSFTDIELASFPCAYGTAENMLTRAGVGAGETVLVTGASGGVGSAAVQLAGRRGARVIAVAAPAKGAVLQSLGASMVLAREADMLSELGSESVDVVVDVVGGERFPPLLEVLRRGGRYAVAGAIGGPMVALDLRTLYLKDLKLLGCTVPEPGVFKSLIGYIERREISPVVSATYPMSAIVAAQKDFLGKSRVGKIVLAPSDSKTRLAQESAAREE